MKTIFPLTLAAIVSTILITSSPVQAAPKDDSIKAANQAVSMEIFWMSLKDTKFEYSMVATINDGVVTLKGPVPYYGEQKPDRDQRQKITGQIQALAGVASVKDELNINTVPTLVAKNDTAH
jgi:osmotically-inducible protein OsmY